MFVFRWSRPEPWALSPLRAEPVFRLRRGSARDRGKPPCRNSETLGPRPLMPAAAKGQTETALHPFPAAFSPFSVAPLPYFFRFRLLHSLCPCSCAQHGDPESKPRKRVLLRLLTRSSRCVRGSWGRSHCGDRPLPGSRFSLKSPKGLGRKEHPVPRGLVLFRDAASRAVLPGLPRRPATGPTSPRRPAPNWEALGSSREPRGGETRVKRRAGGLCGVQ